MSLDDRGPQWVQVSPEVARRYRWYGIGGWLTFFLVVLLLVGAGALVGWVRLLADALPRLDQVQGSLRVALLALFALLTVMLGWLAVTLYRAFTFHPAFPKTISWYFALAALATIFTTLVLREVGPFGSRGHPVARIGAALIVNGLLIYYFLASKRVNATYLHRLDARHPSAADLLAGIGPSATPVSPPTVSPPASSLADSSLGSPVPPAPAPPAAGGDRSVETRLAELKRLFEQGLIDEATYRERQAAILQDL